MARVRKMSIGYYTIPSDYNKTKFLKTLVIKYGSEGFHVIIELDRLILNSDNGFYINNDDYTLFQLQQITGVDRKQIQSIVAYAISKEYYNSKLALDKEKKLITNKSLMNQFIKHTKNRKGLAVSLNRLYRLATLGNIDIKNKMLQCNKEVTKCNTDIDKEKNIEVKKQYTTYIPVNKATKILYDKGIIKKDQLKDVDDTISKIKKKRRTINILFNLKIDRITNDYLSGNITDICSYLCYLYL